MPSISHWLDNDTITVPVPANLAIAVGDAMYWDSATGTAKPFSALVDLLTAPLNERAVAMTFLGFSTDQRLATQTTAGTIVVAQRLTVEYPCASTTWAVGDLVGPVEAASGTALENQVFQKVTSLSQAIGVCQLAGTSQTVVRFFVEGRIASSLEAKNVVFTSNVETLSATKTLTVADAKLQVLDPGGAGRNVVLPKEAQSNGLEYRIVNTADAAEILTIQASNGSTTVCTPTQNEAAVVYCDGTTWRGIVGATN